MRHARGAVMLAHPLRTAAAEFVGVLLIAP
jgi:hypothetical protein